MTPGPEPAGRWQKSIFPVTGEEGALGGLPAEKKLKTGAADHKILQNFQRQALFDP